MIGRGRLQDMDLVAERDEADLVTGRQPADQGAHRVGGGGEPVRLDVVGTHRLRDVHEQNDRRTSARCGPLDAWLCKGCRAHRERKCDQDQRCAPPPSRSAFRDEPGQDGQIRERDRVSWPTLADQEGVREEQRNDEQRGQVVRRAEAELVEAQATWDLRVTAGTSRRSGSGSGTAPTGPCGSRQAPCCPPRGS